MTFRLFRFSLLLAFSALLFSCKTADERAAGALARRVMGDKASAIVFEQTEGDVDAYELMQKGSKVLIRGNNANSMAVGLNRYLQEYCLTNVSWYHFNPVELPEVMPQVPEKVTGTAEVPIRFFLNYCTFGYTMPWWKWEQWERFIDWMALNGVNMPLAITGQEAVWQKVWRKYGLTDEQIRSYFTGPAHLPWHRMNNIDAWQGPLPQSWIDGQAKLQKKILRRERELSMTPALPAFSGHVPAALAQAVDEPIETTPVGSWCHFAPEYNCTFLSPTDPLYARIQKDFLEEQTRMYGTDHIYGVDCFNEVEPPSWDPDTLASISAGVFNSMTAVDPDAVWLQMGWLFVSCPDCWPQERIKAYLTAVPQGRMILLDYESDYVQIWKQTQSFYGQKFIWCYLGNFGGMTEIEGDYHLNAERIAETKAHGGPGFVGIGSTLEGFGVNEPVYESVLAQAWNTGVGLKEYIDNIADRHLGRKDEAFRAYWHQLVDKVSITHTSTEASSIIVAHPSLEGRWNWTTYFNKAYDIAEMEKALSIIETVEGNSDYFQFDLANARRQALRNRALPVRERFTEAYKAGNRAEMVRASEEFLAICDELTAVLKSRPEFSLDDWIEDARSWGTTPEEKDYFERNARTIITVWGDTKHLSDYANRDWDGLVDTFYKVRWQMFFDAVFAAFDAGEPFDNRPLDRAIRQFECQWAHLDDLRIGTYNLRMAPLDKNTPNAWEFRQSRLIESFLKEDMDICAVEEIDSVEQISIPSLLTQQGLEYDSYFFCPYAPDGVGGRAHGLLWKKSRFQAEEPHFFWLSDPPEQMQENDHCGRINYIRGGFCITLKDLQNSGARYFVMVTHAHLNKEDHAQAAHIFVEMEQRYNPEGLPSFFMGDFNAHEEDACYPTYQAYWTDAYHYFDARPELREGPLGTYNGWEPESTVRSDRRIDFIFFRGNVQPLRYQCDSTLFGGYCASDHFPVVLDCKAK